MLCRKLGESVQPALTASPPMSALSGVGASGPKSTAKRVLGESCPNLRVTAPLVDGAVLLKCRNLLCAIKDGILVCEIAMRVVCIMASA
jgi:hypothetical protein